MVVGKGVELGGEFPEINVLESPESHSVEGIPSESVPDQCVDGVLSPLQPNAVGGGLTQPGSQTRVPHGRDHVRGQDSPERITGFGSVVVAVVVVTVVVIGLEVVVRGWP
jgi:hypothetical protein